LKFHPSRVVAFKGEQVGDIVGTAWTDLFWGQSRVQTIIDAVTNVDTADNGFAALIKDARNRRIYIPKLLEMVSGPGGEANLAKRLQAFALGESSNSVSWLDGGDGDKGGERIEDRQMVWTGMPDIMAAYRTAAAAAADMPATVLWGISPAGMNATGDSDIQLWHKTIKGRQDLDAGPCMAQIDAVLIPSALGKVDDAIWYEWAPLSTQSEKDEAQTFMNTMTGLDTLRGTALIPDIALEKSAQNMLEERGWLPGLGDALSELPEDERFPSLSEPDLNDPSALQSGGGDQTTGAQPLRRAANDAEYARVMAEARDLRAPWEPRQRRVNDSRFTDATPRTMYVQRKLLNADELIRWAKSQGFESTLPADDMHVTVAFSRQPVDWMKTGADWSGDEKGNLLVKPGGPRTVERMGDGDAIALQFTDDNLTWRHQRFIEAGASWDWPEYQPHITISWTMPRDFDVSKVVPYVGPLKFGPELFSEVDEDWKAGISEE
jgi:hypothetical protein